MGFGLRLKSVLVEKDLKVSTLAKQTGIPASTLYSIISKDIDNVGAERVARIEKALNAKPGSPIYRMLHDDSVPIEQYKINTDIKNIGTVAESYDNDLREVLNETYEKYRDVIEEWTDTKGYDFLELNGNVYVATDKGRYEFTEADIELLQENINFYLDQELKKKRPKIIVPYRTPEDK